MASVERVRNPWGQGERLREEILDAAARLMSELDGDDALTIRGVARAAGIAPASIYRHFADRAALVEGVRAYDLERLTSAMAGAADAVPDTDPVGQVRAQLHAYCRFGLDNPGHHRLMLVTDKDLPPRTAGEPAAGPLAPLVNALVIAYKRSEEAGCELRMPPRRASVTVFAGTYGRIALWHLAPYAGGLDVVRGVVDGLIGLVLVHPPEWATDNTQC